MTTAAVRRIDESNIVDAATLLAGAEYDIPAVPDPRPGQVIARLGDPSDRDQRFDAIYQGSDMATHATVYDIEGHPFTMPIDWARQRLSKMYPANHPEHPGRPVFYARQPVVPAEPTIPCKSQWKNCPKKFFNLQQRDVHFRKRHETEHQTRLEAERIEREERVLAAQERQNALLEHLAARQVKPVMVGPKRKKPYRVPANPIPMSLDGFPDETWKITDMRQWLVRVGYDLPPKAFGWTKSQWLEHIAVEHARALAEEAAVSGEDGADEDAEEIEDIEGTEEMEEVEEIPETEE